MATKRKKAKWQEIGLTEEQYNEVRYQAKLELCRRDFWEFCKVLAPDFYMEGRDYLKELCYALQHLYESDEKVLIINMPPRHGKLVADYEPVLTKKGWKKHGDLVVGDEVLSPNGNFIKVTHVHPKQEANVRVEFTNGQTVDVHSNHEWVVYDRHAQKMKTVETNYMVGKLEDGASEHKRGHRYRFQLPKVKPIIGEEKDLPVQPYVFGAWLGDGSNTKPAICAAPKDDIVLRECGKHYDFLSMSVHRTTGVYTQSFDGLRSDLHKIGLCEWKERREKYIPDEYLTASIEQRLELLAGLLDTDGSLRKKEHRYIFTTSDEKLKDGFCELVATFGWRTSIREIQPTTSTSGIVGKRVYWQIGFNPTMFIPCRIERKQLHEFSKQRAIAIKSITPLDKPTQGNCITVEGGVYLVGKSLIPTHNSRTAGLFAEWIFGINPSEKIITGSYNEQLSTTFSRNVRDAIMERKASKDRIVYSDIFPKTRLKRGSSAANLWTLEGQHISYLATSPGGTVTGFGASLMIIDDIVKNADEAMNETVLENHWTWFTNTMLSRLEKGGKLVIIATRWNSKDLSGRIIDHYNSIGVPYTLITKKALQDDGTMLCDDVLDRSAYDLIVKTMGREIVEANYNQKPIDLVGRLYNIGFETYTDIPRDEENYSLLEEICAYCDTADQGDDYLCLIIYGLYRGQCYVLDVYFTKDGMEITEGETAKRLYKYQVNRAFIESNNGGRGFGRSVERILREKYHWYKTYIDLFTQRRNKKTRILSSATWCQQNIKFPVGWEINYADFYGDIMAYQKEGKMAHDDAEDSLAGIYDKVGRGNLFSFT